MNKEVTAIVQARLGSSRLPNKVLKKINKKETILILLERLSKAKRILNKNNYKVFRGDEHNVLKRYYNCAKKFDLKNILRITGDNPLVDPKLVDKIMTIYKKNNFDYVSNVEKRTFPKGLDIEVFSFKALEIAYHKANNKFDREHVTPYLKRKKFKRYNYSNKEDFSKIRVTLDTIDDFFLIEKIFSKIGNKFIHFKDIVRLYKKNRNIFFNQ